MLRTLFSKLPADAAPFIRFCVIGVVNTAIHFCGLKILVEAAGVEKAQANACAFLIANVFSFYANSRWNFKTPMGVLRYVLFLATSLVGATISYTAMCLGEAAGWHYYATFAAQTALMPFVNFTLLRLLVFRRKEKKNPVG